MSSPRECVVSRKTRRHHRNRETFYGRDTTAVELSNLSSVDTLVSRFDPTVYFEPFDICIAGHLYNPPCKPIERPKVKNLIGGYNYCHRK